MADVPGSVPPEVFDFEKEWPDPAAEGSAWVERPDPHLGPLDDDEDGRWLERDDPRRIEAERRLGRTFSPPEDDDGA